MISFIAPLYNQEEFIRAWCEFTTRVSDDIIACDTGCTDSTFDIIKEYPKIQTFRHYVKKKYEWPEGKIRNELIDSCKNEWVFWLDGDELLDDGFVKALPDLCRTKQDVIWFRHMSFWLSPNLLRCRSFKDYHDYRYFYPSRIWKMFRNRDYLRYEDRGNHAQLRYHGLNVRVSSRYVDIPYFHYHHCIGREGRHNRANEYLDQIKTVTYWGNHPKEVSHYDWWEELFPAKGIVWDENHYTGIRDNYGKVS